MQPFRYFFCSSVGKKQLVGLTGLGLSLFVLGHMCENLLLFAGPDAYNRYTRWLTSLPFLPIIEIALLLCFLVHIYFAINITVANRSARPVSPEERANCAKSARFGSRSMILTGLLVFFFVVSHLLAFKWGPYYTVNIDNVEARDIYRLVLEKFQSPGFVAWYLVSLVVLGLHLSHGFAASFQSLGFFSVRNPRVKKAGFAFAAIVAAGFIAQPIYLFLTGGK